MKKLNEKAEMFQRFINKKDPTAFQILEVPGAPLHDVMFRSQMNVEGTPVPVIVEMDDSPFGIIRVVLEMKAEKDGNREALAKAMNELNAHYKIYKFFLDAQGNLLMDTSVIFRDANVDGNMIYGLFELMLRDLKEIQKQVKAAVYGENAEKAAAAPAEK